MTLALLVLAQAAAPLDSPAVRDFDLARVDRAAARRGCIDGRAADGDILVCAPRALGGDIPVQSFPEPALPRAEIGIAGDVRGSVYLESVGFPNGMVSKRIMFGIKLPF